MKTIYYLREKQPTGTPLRNEPSCVGTRDVTRSKFTHFGSKDGISKSSMKWKRQILLLEKSSNIYRCHLLSLFWQFNVKARMPCHPSTRCDPSSTSWTSDSVPNKYMNTGKIEIYTGLVLTSVVMLSKNHKRNICVNIRSSYKCKISWYVSWCKLRTNIMAIEGQVI
jgi:hypothetical protein